MLLKGEHLGYQIVAVINENGQAKLTCEVLTDSEGHRLTFTEPEKLRKAIARYDLSLRKAFSNPIAYRILGTLGKCRVDTVTVTSLVENGLHCWILTDSLEREKILTESLLRTKESAERLADEMNKAHTTHQETMGRLTSQARTAQWKPEN